MGGNTGLVSTHVHTHTRAHTQHLPGFQVDEPTTAGGIVDGLGRDGLPAPLLAPTCCGCNGYHNPPLGVWAGRVVPEQAKPMRTQIL